MDIMISCRMYSMDMDLWKVSRPFESHFMPFLSGLSLSLEVSKKKNNLVYSRSFSWTDTCWLKTLETNRHPADTKGALFDSMKTKARWALRLQEGLHPKTRSSWSCSAATIKTTTHARVATHAEVPLSSAPFSKLHWRLFSGMATCVATSWQKRRQSWGQSILPNSSSRAAHFSEGLQIFFNWAWPNNGMHPQRW